MFKGTYTSCVTTYQQTGKRGNQTLQNRETQNKKLKWKQSKSKTEECYEVWTTEYMMLRDLQQAKYAVDKLP